MKSHIEWLNDNAVMQLRQYTSPRFQAGRVTCVTSGSLADPTQSIPLVQDGWPSKPPWSWQNAAKSECIRTNVLAQGTTLWKMLSLH